jgi:hypothetical protein
MQHFAHSFFSLQPGGIMRKAVVALVLLVAAAVVTHAQIPRTLSYQGVLTDQNGTPRTNGTYYFTFKLYEAAFTGRPLWTQAESLFVNGGLFSTALGTNPFPSSMKFDRQYWLGIQVGTESELTPRIALSSSAYSMNSLRADTAWVGRMTGGDSVWSVSGSNVYRLNGNVGIGTTTPNEQLELTGNFKLPPTTATTGMINVGTNRFIHGYGISNTFIGQNAGNLTMTGSANTANGTEALLSNTTGTQNTAIGNLALHSNNTGSLNTATGEQALLSNTTGTRNTASGMVALRSNTEGRDNTANGYAALRNNTTGSWNTANGMYALYYNTTGEGNTANGREALYANTTGSSNVANGVAALSSNTTGSYNSAFGRWALSYNTTGNNNTANGKLALHNNTTGSYNTANGLQALSANTTGDGNTACGDSALSENLTGNNNTALGSRAGEHCTGSGNVFIGYRAGPTVGGASDELHIGNFQGYPLIYGSFRTGRVGIGTVFPTAKLDVEGRTRTQVLEITGGSDIAEPFPITESELLEPGSVVIIDEGNPGSLKLSFEPYDKRVAGVVSGAGGIKPGMVMSQAGSVVDGDCPLALTGRVYCMADAASSPITPGDLLTTSSVPGHAMKVIDFAKAQGAILGKAMSCLDHGQGLVLILVTLQ